MSNHANRLASLAGIIADYRKDEIPARTPTLVEEWLQQFPSSIQEQLLKAILHVFKKTYISRDAFKSFLEALATTDKLSPGCDPATYWRTVNLLDIQGGGNSQKDILEMFDEVLRDTHGYGVCDCGSEGGDYAYLDDCIGTGGRVRGDICDWMEEDIPSQITLHIITPVYYMGSWWIDAKIKDAAATHGRSVSLHKWRLDDFEMENRLGMRDSSDVLWPTELPDDKDVRAYARYLDSCGHSAILRKPGSPGVSGIFRDDADRILIEQAFLLRGCQIRRECPNLPDPERPLGHHNLDCLGFGSMFATYRNCPNNCPLVLWVQQEEYPALLPRKTNSQTAEEKFMRGLSR
jgi:hypothetical protein